MTEKKYIADNNRDFKPKPSNFRSYSRNDKSPRDKNPRDRNYQRKPVRRFLSEKERKVKKFVQQYGMDESVALEIACGIISLDDWFKREKEKEQKLNLHKNFEKDVKSFSSQAVFSIPCSMKVLEGTFGLGEYRTQKYNRLEREKKAHQLVKENEIPIYAARLIIDGKTTLEEHRATNSEKQDRKKKAEELKGKYQDLAIETCYQIVDRSITVETYLKERENNKKKRGSWYQTYLEDNIEDNRLLNQYFAKLRKLKVPVILYLYGKESVSGTISSYNPYEIVLKNRQGKKNYPKLKIKYFCRLNYAENVYNSVNLEDTIREKPFQPDPDPQKRYNIPEELLKEKETVTFTLGEGEEFSGTVQWSSKYDIKLSLNRTPKATVMIFRHAIVQAKK